ncbi:MAG: GGDEF domain-containing protein, partial [Clostridia bacterium]|nr:GGDEF domain-containing protein [Clostridia bacterium]
ICRIGGDEFTVILRGVTSENEEHIREKMEHIMKLLSEKKDNLPTVTVSIGVAFGTTDLSFKDLYKNADKALYKIKSTTRNGVEFYTE